MWITKMTRWLRWRITWSRDHGFRTCEGHGVIDYMPIMLLVALWSISVNALVHTKHVMWSGRCINEISQQSWMMRKLLVMYTWYVQTPSSSHGEWYSGRIGTLLVEIFRYDVGDKGKHLMENIGSTWLTRSLGMRLWIWAPPPEILL
jgi:hypothetical protein